MEKDNEEVKEKDVKKAEAEKELILKAKRLRSSAEEHRKKFDWEWMVRTLYARGHHFARYHQKTGTVVFGNRTGVRIPINLVGAHLRGVRNQVTSFQPKWEVMPNVTTESAFENARYSGKVLDHVYKKAQIKRKIKEVVNDALIHSIGIWYFDIDKKKNIVINRIDPFDFWVDPNIKSPDINDPEYGAEFVVLSQQFATESIKNNPKFEHTDELEGDNKPASAEYKRFLLQVTRRQYEQQSEDNQTNILHRAFLRERQDDGTFKIRIVTYLDSMDKPLRNELTDDEEYPFEIYQGDIASGELYG